MHYPQILSWLSARAGIDEARGQAIWDAIVDAARQRIPNRKSAAPHIGTWSPSCIGNWRVEASRNGCSDWLDNLQDAPQLTALLDFQTTLLTRMMLAWRDVAVASTRTWTQGHNKRSGRLKLNGGVGEAEPVPASTSADASSNTHAARRVSPYQSRRWRWVEQNCRRPSTAGTVPAASTGVRPWYRTYFSAR